MGFDKRNTPGPGQYQPRRSKTGGSAGVGESPGAFSTTAHGFSVDGGASKDASLIDYAVTGPWISYSRNSTRLSELREEGGQLFVLKGAAGKQLLSTKRTQPRTAFSKARRNDPSDASAGRSPGPAVYDTTRFESVGRKKIPVTASTTPSYSIGQRIPTSDETVSPGPIYSAHVAAELGGYRDVSHSAVFNRAPRTPASKSPLQPGPGMYALPSSMGRQPASIRTSSPSPMFTRTKLSYQMPKGNPVHISNQHVQDQVGKDSPGPQAHADFGQTRKGKAFLGGKGSIGVRFPKAKRMEDPKHGPGNPAPPGPGAYKCRESMGKQLLSTLPTSTSAFRTTAERSKWSKTYISAAHMQDAAGFDSPGPDYEPIRTMTGAALVGGSGMAVGIGTAPRDKTVNDPGPGPDAYEVKRTFDRPTSAPLASGSISGFSFSTETEHSEFSPRGDLHIGRDIDQVLLQGTHSPGPGTYLNSTSQHLYSSVGGTNPALKRSGGVKFGTARRTGQELEVGSGDVGPGEYDAATYTSIGNQPSSTRKSAKGFTMPKCEPDKESKVFISKMHSRADATGCKGGPGPGAYALGSRWQLSSKKKASPSFSFGSGPRSSFLYL